MNKYLFSALALAVGTGVWAATDLTETMTVVKTDGTSVEFNVADIERVDFAVVETSYAMVVTPSEGEAVKVATIPTVFRVDDSTAGVPVILGFSMVDAAEPADARQGEYAIELSVSALKFNIADEINLSDGADSGVTATLYRYADGEVDNVWDVQTSGTLTTAFDAKSKTVTVKLEAGYEDGTVISLDYKGSVVMTESLKGFNPPFEYINQGQYFNADGVGENIFNVESVSYTANVKQNGLTFDRFILTLSNYQDCKIFINPEYYGQLIDFADAPADSYYVTYAYAMQLGSENTARPGGYYVGLQGTLKVVKGEDNHYVIDLDVTNFYRGTYGNSGTPERVVLNFTGVVD